MLGLAPIATSGLPPFAEEIEANLIAEPPELNPHDQWKNDDEQKKLKRKSTAKPLVAKKAKLASSPASSSTTASSTTASSTASHPIIAPELNKRSVMNVLDYEELCRRLREAGVPDEALPSALPKGKHSFTKFGPDGAKLEINLKQRHVRVQAMATGTVAFAGSPNQPFQKFDSFCACWAHAKRISGWA